MTAINGIGNQAILAINGGDEELQLLPHQHIQTAVTQLQLLNETYNTRTLLLADERGRFVCRNRCDTWVFSICGVIAYIVATIFVPLKLKSLLSCDKPDGSCVLDFGGPHGDDCVVGYDWCPLVQYMGNTLWGYVTNNLDQSWASSIYDYCVRADNLNGAFDTFVFGLTVICNSTEGTTISTPLTVDFPISNLLMESVFYTLGAHVLGQAVTWGIDLIGLEVPPLSMRESYELYKNLSIVRDNETDYQRELLTLAQPNAPLPLLADQAVKEESERILKQQTRRYICNLTSICLYPTAIVMFYIFWMATLKFVHAIFNHNDPYEYVKLPSPCQQNTYEAAYYNGWVSSSDLTIPIPGGIQDLFDAGIPSAGLEAKIINTLAVGFFTGLITPALAVSVNLIVKYMPYYRGFCRNRQNEMEILNVN